jgi:DNA-binding MarR family transcriptional regulator
MRKYVNGIDRIDEPNRPLALLYFAFRKVTERPDRILARHGLTRVHHRILYFVGRSPGLSVGDLLRVLSVSKQALHRPMRQLLSGGWLAAEPVPGNRRAKALRLTARGARLEERLSGDQRERFSRAFAAVGKDAAAAWAAVMQQLAEEPRTATAGKRSSAR